MADVLWQARLSRRVEDTFFQGTVTDIQLDPRTGETIYLVTYDDGDLEHLTKGQVLEWIAPPPGPSASAHPTGAR
eukprot:4368680-Prorocentrum_lima.AAC.1